MRKIVLLIFLITFFIKIDHLLAQKKNFEQGKPQYGNMGDDPEFNADAPWRVNGSDVSIPIMVLIKDADAEGDDVTLQKIEIKYNDFIIYSYDPEPDELINQGLWVKYFNEKSANDIGIPINSTAEFIVKLYLHDDGFDYTYEKHLQVYIASDDFPTFNNWYSGDTHFHSFYTDNNYEYGGPLESVNLMSNALGLDWITITDHSCDFDAGGNQFNDLQQEIDNVNNSNCIIIRGEEVTVDNDNEDNTILADDKLHLLVYKNEFIRGPENPRSNTEDTDGILTKLTEALNQVNNDGFAYAAHPTNDEDPWYTYYFEQIVGIGALMKWNDSNYNQAFSYIRFKGLQIWNERNTFERNVSSSNVNPFPWTDGSDKSGEYKAKLDEGIDIWENKLLTNLNPLRKLFLSGGSDAHGDFNYRTYKKAGVDLYATNSAFAKVRTVAYANSKSEDAILKAFRKGHTFVTDGPAAIFSIDFDGDGNFETILGDSVFLPPKYYNEDVTKIRIDWKNTDEFGGNIKYMYLYLNDQNTSLIGYFGINVSKEGTSEFSLKEFIESFNLPYIEDEYFYLRLEVFTENFDFRCYTNPIWIYIDSDYLLADFDSDVQEGAPTLTVQFEDLSISQDDIQNWNWDFGDGETSTLQNPSHTYSETGSYTVSLTVTTVKGNVDTKIKENYINVNYNVVDGLIAYWSFDDGTATDNTGNGHDGNILGDPSVVQGKYGNAFEFGEGKYIEIPVSSLLKDFTAGPHTYSCWIKPTNYIDNECYILEAAYPELGANLGDQRGIRFEWGRDLPTFKWVTDNGSYRVRASTACLPNVWHHIVGVYDENFGYIYIDGKKENSEDSQGIPQQISNFFIAATDGGKNPFHGVIDEIRLFNRALSEEEILNLYNYNDQSLPVTLHSFTAKGEDDKIIIEWITESEINNLGFEIYRSLAKDSGYVKLSSYKFNPGLQGAGSSSHYKKYKFEDKNVIKNITYWYKLIDVDYTGRKIEHGPVSARLLDSKNDEVISVLPEKFYLYANYPNPFNGTTTISFDLAEDCHVSLDIYNVYGQKIETLLNEDLSKGNYKLIFNGENLTSGLYYYRIITKKFHQVRKMLIIK